MSCAPGLRDRLLRRPMGQTTDNSDDEERRYLRELMADVRDQLVDEAREDLSEERISQRMAAMVESDDDPAVVARCETKATPRVGSDRQLAEVRARANGKGPRFDVAFVDGVWAFWCEHCDLGMPGRHYASADFEIFALVMRAHADDVHVALTTDLPEADTAMRVRSSEDQ